jgi:hypothetical protein
MIDSKNITISDTAAAVVADKRRFAARWLFSVRHMDNLLADGLPHLKIGKRRVRIIVAEGDAWMREKFGARRNGPLKTSAD